MSLFLTGENPNVNSKVYRSCHGKIMNIKEDRMVFNLSHGTMMMNM